eukprot:TRINITY_DN3760_c0_g1_i1.p1 TRINITY_DN3760_c0_g1~~TRINITY_DN3760_c0_g1_i1.p1  ORF type:complete len:1013 (+),score=342.03 TRINITY_DN3760_c0_g1_i1:76-3039(+)
MPGTARRVDGAGAAYGAVLDSELAALRQEVLDDLEERRGMKRALAWGEELGSRCREVIEELERNSADIDIGIQNVAQRHVGGARDILDLLQQCQKEGGEVQLLGQMFEGIDERLRSEQRDSTDFLWLKRVHNTLLNVQYVKSVVSTLLDMRARQDAWMSALQSPGEDEGPQVSDVYAQVRDVILFVEEVRKQGKYVGDFGEYFSVLENVLHGVVRSLRAVFLGLLNVSQRVFGMLRQKDQESVLVLLEDESERVRDAMRVVHMEMESPALSTVFANSTRLFNGGDDASEIRGNLERAELQRAGMKGLVVLWVRWAVQDAWAGLLGLPDKGFGAERERLALAEGRLDIEKLFNGGTSIMVTWMRVFKLFMHYIVSDNPADRWELRESDALWNETMWGGRKVPLHVAGAAACECHKAVLIMIGACLSFIQSNMRSVDAALAMPDILAMVRWTHNYETFTQDVYGGMSAFDWAAVGITQQSAEYPMALLESEAKVLEGHRQELLRIASASMTEFLCKMAMSQAVEVRGSKGQLSTNSAEDNLSTRGPTDLFVILREKADEIIECLPPTQNDGASPTGIDIVASFAGASAEACERYGMVLLQDPGAGAEECSDEEWYTRLLHLCAFTNDTSVCEREVLRLYSELRMRAGPASRAKVDKGQERSLGCFRHAANVMADAVAVHLVAVEQSNRGHWKALFESLAPEDRAQYASRFFSRRPMVARALGSVLLTIEDYVIHRTEEEGAFDTWLDSAHLRRVLGAVQRAVCSEYLSCLVRRMTDSRPIKLGPDVGSVMEADCETIQSVFDGIGAAVVDRDPGSGLGSTAMALSGVGGASVADAAAAAVAASAAASRALSAVRHVSRLCIVQDAATFDRAARQLVGDFPDTPLGLVLLICERRAEWQSSERKKAAELLSDLREGASAHPSIFARHAGVGPPAKGGLFGRKQAKQQAAAAAAPVAMPDPEASPTLGVTEPDAGVDGDGIQVQGLADFLK